MLCVLGKLSTRTQLLLHRFQIILGIRWTVRNIEVDRLIGKARNNMCPMYNVLLCRSLDGDMQ